MNRVVVEHVTKEFRLYRSPRERLLSALSLRGGGTPFQALRDISFTVPEGAFVGIIGRNGAGKSTLLKILAGISQPSSGQCHVAGRRAALLDLGGGFNPEFTGIQNIYFVSSCMGYTRTQIDAFLPDILAFADIGEFAQNPVKTYSSGMFVRLAFAVAVNVDPDVLILDEVLAVGDVRFQQKCIRKIQDFQRRGKTILFVTHDTGAVVRFCSEAIWIDQGAIREAGNPDTVVRNYLAFMNQMDAAAASDANEASPSTAPGGGTGSSKIPWESVDRCESFGTRGVTIQGVSLCHAETTHPATALHGTEPLDLHIDYESHRDIAAPIFGFTLKDRLGTVILEANTDVYRIPVHPLAAGERRHVRFRFALPSLRNGEFSLSVAVAEGDQTRHIQHHWVHDALTITIENSHPSRTLGGLVYADNITYSESTP